MPERPITRSSFQRVEPFAQAFENRLGCELAALGGSQLERKREAVEPAAYLGDHRRRGRVEGEIGVDRLGTLHEQRDRRHTLELANV